MNTEVCLTQQSDGTLLLSAGGPPEKVYTVAQAVRRLKRSRRQVYRGVKAGLLPARAKLLGELLLEAAAVDRAAAAPSGVQPLPASLAPLFPEYDLPSLDAGRDKVLVLGRVLQAGGRAAAAWAFNRYGRRELATFVEAEGSRLLEPRPLAFWSLVLGVKARPAASLRRRYGWRAQ
jgi:hypothetical protein